MSADRWWVEAQGRAWGPYPLSRLSRFASEGRLGPESRVARVEAGPFARAADAPALAALFARIGPAATLAAAPPAGDDRGATSVGLDAEPQTPASRTLLVISDAPEAGLAQLEVALAAQGEIVRIRAGLWLLRTASPAAGARNALSRDLRDGMLLVVEAPLAAAAWFALGGETDRALRRLWTG